MKLTATAGHTEALPPKVWEAIKRAVVSIGNEWGIPLSITEDLTVRDAEQRFWMWQRGKIEDE